MATNVGNQSNFQDALKALIELELDALGAYDYSIEKLSSSERKQKLSEFRGHHQSRIAQISSLMQARNCEVPTKAPMLEEMLAKGKLFVADLASGEKGLLKGMLGVEEDAITAYQNMKNHHEKWSELVDLFEKAHQEELMHRSWIEQEIKSFK